MTIDYWKEIFFTIKKKNDCTKAFASKQFIPNLKQINKVVLFNRIIMQTVRKGAKLTALKSIMQSSNNSLHLIFIHENSRK